jgi:hypothetical protein
MTTTAGAGAGAGAGAAMAAVPNYRNRAEQGRLQGLLARGQGQGQQGAGTELSLRPLAPGTPLGQRVMQGIPPYAGFGSRRVVLTEVASCFQRVGVGAMRGEYRCVRVGRMMVVVVCVCVCVCVCVIDD